ncbi:5-formyltetrahydrofolate cyclo-ligase [Roseibium denhamense]|uniref:5-formyltetrahydrofolate cyclo-ligase n=1 Tax=Roseibium denhamense TaxID=76305 RepID=A0ABY1NJH4_9HYPH|nr:5-formyltetrahydrofolate cyclo-ligase [Roseibium denhamense]MTI06782.1 5-formyltetrahydrofolate cyclo-ligase [Roseibium denhamense]SMP11267.1 5-formyltetrahydrofolate cyclo-ligase [Roseibium denhamense]
MTDSLSLASQKHELRKLALSRRKSLPEVERIEKSLELADHADALPLPPGAVVAGFWPIRDEIDPRPLMDGLRQSGFRLCLPVVADPHLIFRTLDRGTALEPAGFGTLAPGADAPEIQPDALLMPLAGFDRLGNRIGYGKGHYDTAIAALEKNGPLLCIGLAFAVQEVDRVPVEAHDKPLDGILTEKGYRAFGSYEP